MKLKQKVQFAIISLLGIGTFSLSYFFTTKSVLAEYVNDDNLNTFPINPGSQTFVMDVNNGNVGTLQSGYTIDHNFGEITNANGKVNTNEETGLITNLYGSVISNNNIIKNIYVNATVSYNNGTIEYINSGVVSINGKEGKICNNNGGIIQENSGTIDLNNSKINKMLGGVVNETTTYSTIYFSDTAADGKIITNKGIVYFENATNKQIEIANNYGYIYINGGKVKITNNYGEVTIKNNGAVVCENNFGTIKKDDNAEFYDVQCNKNYGSVGFMFNSTGYNNFTTVKDYEAITFVGDNGKAQIISYDTLVNEVYYTSNRFVIKFSLPDGYVCDNENAILDDQEQNIWKLETIVSCDEKEYKVNCHQCHGTTQGHDGNNHWVICDECNRNIDIEAHSGEFISNNDATCITDGTKTCICEICGYEGTIIDVDSHLTSEKHNVVVDPRVEPTYETTGLSEGSHCSDCNKVIVAQEVLPCLLDGYIVINFTGLDNDPILLSEFIEYKNNIYVLNNSNVQFELNADCVCDDENAINDSNNSTKWTLFVHADSADAFTIECHKCSFTKSLFNNNEHWTECSICGRKSSEGLVSHTLSNYSSNNDATCASDGTKTRKCSSCNYSETITDEGSSKLVEHRAVVDARVEPTYEATGLTEGSRCSVCGKTIVAQEEIPMLEKEPEEEKKDESLAIILTLAIGIPVSVGVVYGYFCFKRYKKNSVKK